MKHLYVIAHPEAAHHVRGLVGGWFDAELTELGHRQAELIGRRIRDLVPEGADVELYSSDLTRAAQTAEAVGRHLGVSPRWKRDLREKSYGEAEERPQVWLDARFRPPPASGDRLDHSEIPGAETKRDFATRIYRVIEEILASRSSHQVVVTHGFAVTFVIAAWIKMPLEAAGYVNFASSSGGITHLIEDDYFHNRGVAVVNDTSHLHAKQGNG